MQDDLPILTHSAIQMFKDCRWKYYLRTRLEIVPREVDEVLRVGTMVHEALAQIYRNEVPILAEPTSKPAAVARAMIQAYLQKFPHETLAPADKIEHTVVNPIRNPITGKLSRSFRYGMKVDRIRNAETGGFELWENKTTSTVDQGYVEKLWMDQQIHLYADQLALHGYPINEVVYNVLRRPGLRPYEVNSKRSEPETFEAFSDRCYQDLLEKPGSLMRIRVPLNPEHVEELRHELWDLTQELLHAETTGHWYKNTGSCWKWNKPCPYWKLCSSGMSKAVEESHYRHEEANVELREEAPF